MRKIKNYLQERYNNYFLFSVLTYLSVIVIFGKFTILGLIYLPVSIILFWVISNWDILSGKIFPEFINSMLFGFSLSIYDMTILGISSEGSYIKLNVYLGGAICLLSILVFNIFIERYRNKVKKDYNSQFIDGVSRDRDMKIKSLLGNF